MCDCTVSIKICSICDVAMLPLPLVPFDLFCRTHFSTPSSRYAAADSPMRLQPHSSSTLTLVDGPMFPPRHARKSLLQSRKTSCDWLAISSNLLFFMLLQLKILDSST